MFEALASLLRLSKLKQAASRTEFSARRELLRSFRQLSSLIEASSLITAYNSEKVYLRTELRIENTISREARTERRVYVAEIRERIANRYVAIAQQSKPLSPDLATGTQSFSTLVDNALTAPASRAEFSSLYEQTYLQILSIVAGIAAYPSDLRR